jgi:hypothetical protein
LAIQVFLLIGFVLGSFKQLMKPQLVPNVIGRLLLLSLIIVPRISEVVQRPTGVQDSAGVQNELPHGPRSFDFSAHF